MLSTVVGLANGSLAYVGRAISDIHTDISGKLDCALTQLETLPEICKLVEVMNNGFRELSKKLLILKTKLEGIQATQRLLLAGGGDLEAGLCNAAAPEVDSVDEVASSPNHHILVTYDSVSPPFSSHPVRSRHSTAPRGTSVIEG